MSACEFRVGQKVVVVKLDGHDNVTTDTMETTPNLRTSEIYTVRWVGESAFWHRGREVVLPAIRIQERVRTFSHGQWFDWPMAARRFRPLEDDHYDISIFQQMCVDAAKSVPATE